MPPPATEPYPVRELEPLPMRTSSTLDLLPANTERALRLDALDCESPSSRALKAVCRVIPLGAEEIALERQNSCDGKTCVGRILHSGVRKHAMGAIANGRSCHRRATP